MVLARCARSAGFSHTPNDPLPRVCSIAARVFPSRRVQKTRVELRSAGLGTIGPTLTPDAKVKGAFDGGSAGHAPCKEVSIATPLRAVWPIAIERTKGTSDTKPYHVRAQSNSGIKPLLSGVYGWSPIAASESERRLKRSGARPAAASGRSGAPRWSRCGGRCATSAARPPWCDNASRRRSARADRHRA